jgi:hypothetical protein
MRSCIIGINAASVFRLVDGSIERLQNVTTNNTELHCRDYCDFITQKAFSVFAGCCLVVASSIRCSPSSEFLNCPQPQLPASRFSQLQLSDENVIEQWLLIDTNRVCRMGCGEMGAPRSISPVFHIALTAVPCNIHSVFGCSLFGPRKKT